MPQIEPTIQDDLERETRVGRPRLDPAWLYLLAGLALLASVLTINAHDQVEAARLEREQVLAIERHRHERLERYNEYLSALDRADPTLVQSLVVSQLNQVPISRATIPGTLTAAKLRGDAAVFPALEPEPLEMPTATKVDSLLARLVRGERSRVWLLAASGVLILVGLLPASEQRKDEPPRG